MERKGERGMKIRDSSIFLIVFMFLGAGLIGLVLNVPEATAPGSTVDFIVIRDAPKGGGNPVGDQTYILGDTDKFYAAGYNYTTGYVGEVEADWWSYNPWVGDVEPDRDSTFVTFTTTGGGMTTVYAYHNGPDNQRSNATGDLTVISPVDEIIIRTAPNNGGQWVGDKTYYVGDTDTFYAAGYNVSTGSYIGDVMVYWSSSDPLVGSVSNNNQSEAYSTTFTALSAGSVVVTASHYSMTKPVIFNQTGTITVIYYPIDYVVVRDTQKGGGKSVSDNIYYVGDTDTYFAAGYNNTHGYQGDFAANWTSDNTTVCTVNSFGVSTTMTATAVGTCKVTAEYNGKTDETGTLTVRPVITVDDSGGADYLTIQEAIDAAIPGGRIFVYQGIYYENVVVYKPVRIKGEDRNGTIIDGSGSGTVVLITANEVEIERFTIQNGQYGLFLDKSEDTKITSNLIKDYEYGIYNNRTINCYIAHNEITSGKYGLVTYQASNDAVRWNTISYNTEYGAKDFNSELKNCFNWNRFYHNKIGYWYDPTIQLSELEFDGNILEYNEIGVKVSDASTVRVTNNTIKYGDYGVYIERASPWIFMNEIKDYKFGVYAKISNSVIEKNIIIGSDYGMYSYDSSPKIIENSIMEALKHSIHIEKASEIELTGNDVDDISVSNSKATILNSTVPILTLSNTQAKLIGSTVLDLSLDPSSSLTAQWFLRVNVEDVNGERVEDAMVRILDCHDNEVENLRTDSDGRTGLVVLTEYVRDSKGQMFHTPHTIIAEKEDAKSEEIVTMNENRFIELTIQVPVKSVDEFPWLFLIVIGSITALGIGGLLATEVGKYAFIALFIPLYMKIKKETVLDHYERGRVYQYIALSPGEHYNSIKKGLGLNNGSLTYHLHVLEKTKKIKSRQDGIYKRFYPYDSIVPQTNGGLTEVQKRIINCIKELPDASQKELAAVLGVRQSTLSYQLTKLESAGLIESVRERRCVRYIVKDSNEKRS
jgi:predicted transcriptional regulator/nitrous oxidase accessory protein NosD